MPEFSKLLNFDFWRRKFILNVLLLTADLNNKWISCYHAWRDLLYFPRCHDTVFLLPGQRKRKQARWIYCSVFSSRADDAETTTKTRSRNTLLQGKTWEFLISPNSTKLSRKLHNHAVLFYRLRRREAGKSQAVGLPAGAASRLRMGPY